MRPAVWRQVGEEAAPQPESLAAPQGSSPVRGRGWAGKCVPSAPHVSPEEQPSALRHAEQMPGAVLWGVSTGGRPQALREGLPRPTAQRLGPPAGRVDGAPCPMASSRPGP